MADPRRQLPQVDRLVRELADTVDLPRAVVVDAIRDVVASARRRARRTKQTPSSDEVMAACRDALRRRRSELLQPVVNATGVVLHTNLGRAPISERALAAVADVARGYSNLEWDLERGRRGDRYVHVEPSLAVATGAQAALVVNNNAAAVLLICAGLAAGSEVVISRGELIEIGGSFRIPEVMEMSGAVLKEVGTTNRTRAADYERAIGDRTGLVLKVHPSNYRVVGFTAGADVAEIAAVAKRAKVPFAYDAGSGLLPREMSDEPVVADVLRAGADLVCFSGDKLFGGPQAGIIVGRKRLVDRLRSHPLLRALRPDKMQLAALAETVRAYLDHEPERLGVWRMIESTPEELHQRSERVAETLRKAGYTVELAGGASVVGGGSLPGHEIPTPVLNIRQERLTPKALAAELARASTPVVVTTDRRDIVVDLRTVTEDQDALLIEAFETALP